MISDVVAIAVAVIASGVTYGIQVRNTRLADEAARALADARLVESVQLLLPALQSGKMMRSNMTILKQRAEKLDDPVVFATYRKKSDVLGAIGQVQIAVQRMSIMMESEELNEESARHYAQAGIENALLAISAPHLRSYVEGIAQKVGFKPVSADGPVILARVREKGS